MGRQGSGIANGVNDNMLVYFEDHEKPKILTKDEISNHIRNICDYGYTLIPSYLPMLLVEKFKGRLEDIFSVIENDPEYFKKGAPLGLQRLISQDRIINNLVAYDKLFVDYSTTGDYLHIVDYFLKDKYYGLIPEKDHNFILAQLNARAANVALPFHVDTRMVTEGMSTWSIQSFLSLGNLERGKGGLRVVPKSHKSGVFPKDSEIDINTVIDLQTGPGDLVLFSSQLHHGTYGSLPTSSWSILATYRCWWCKQQFALYELTAPELYSCLSDNQKLLLGGASVTPNTINASASARTGYANLWKPKGDYEPSS